MRQTEMKGADSSACGYGLLGLCCSNCLLGPCRLTPFDEDSMKGLCGDDRDRMVAGNLLRLATREAFRGLQNLKETVLKLTSPGVSSILLEESKGLLSLFPERAGALVSSLYAEKVFPSIRQIFGGSGFPPNSLVNLLLDSVDLGERESSTMEEILTGSLLVSLAMLIMVELRMNLSRTVQGGGSDMEDNRISEVLERLPSTPCPVIIHLPDGEVPSHPSLSQRVDQLRQELGGTAPMIAIKGSDALPEIGRKLFEKWALSVTNIKSMAFISSRHVTSVLGALALGYAVVSFPPLPIHGSSRVEKFFCEDFRKIFGNAYLPSWEENASAKIREHIKGLA